MSFVPSLSQLSSNTDVQVIFMNGLKFQTIDSIVQDHLVTVHTNTDIARKEVWFLAQTIEEFWDAYNWSMQTPTGTPINKRLFFIATHTPNWNSINFWLKRDKRVFCLTDKFSVRVAFWAMLGKYHLENFMRR